MSNEGWKKTIFITPDQVVNLEECYIFTEVCAENMQLQNHSSLYIMYITIGMCTSLQFFKFTYQIIGINFHKATTS